MGGIGGLEVEGEGGKLHRSCEGFSTGGQFLEFRFQYSVISLSLIHI